MATHPSPPGAGDFPDKAATPAARPQLSVIIATYNRAELLSGLLAQLARQTLSPQAFEVVVVDDGSSPPVAPRLSELRPAFGLRTITQPNAGAAAARHAGALQAHGETLVLLDDDMEIPENFLAAHLARHRSGESRVVLGHIRPAPRESHPPVFQRYHAAKIDARSDEFQSGRDRPRGIHLYTGNVSLRAADYLRVGGFDPALRRSEDVELGVRLEESGAEFVFAPEAYSVHHSDRASAAGWRRDSRLYGQVGVHIAHKHPQRSDLHPYRFLSDVNPASLPLLVTALLRPGAGQGLAAAGLGGASLLERLGLEALALKAAALAHGLDYFSGVGAELGNPGSALAEAVRYLAAPGSHGTGLPELPHWLAVARQELAADYEIALRSRASYSRGAGFPVDLMHRVGLQMMAAYRVMRALRRAHHPLAAKAVSRLIRHLYGADIHWDAEIAPGVHIVHGMGMAISGRASVGPGSVLCQHVTLGEGRHPVTGEGGAPQVGANVHVGAGATLLGPIVIGDDSKVMPGAVVLDSVPRDSIVEVALATVRPRHRRERTELPGGDPGLKRESP
jgi:serine acetyltransferase/GT2 family glycosyltransferase